MVQMIAPTLPPRLYRYRNVDSKENLEREINAIRQNHLWCSQFEQLNDPMEGIFGMTPTAARAPDGPQIPQEVQSVMRQMGVCCFSDTYENDLMWIHYAGEYRVFAWNIALTIWMTASLRCAPCVCSMTFRFPF